MNNIIEYNYLDNIIKSETSNDYKVNSIIRKKQLKQELA